MASVQRAIEMAALGRPFKLGMLYDCKTEKIVPGLTLWDNAKLGNDIIKQRQETSNFEVVASDTLSNKANALDISASLKLSFLGGMIKVSGSGQYLNDRTSSSHQERVSMNYKCTTRFESLAMDQLAKDKIQHPDVMTSGIATHVVTGIVYGVQAVFVFDQQKSESDEKREVGGSLHVLIDKIPNSTVEGDASLKLSEEENQQSNMLNVQFYGDFMPPSNPTTYKESVQLCKRLPELLGQDYTQAVPVTVWLTPLSHLDSKAFNLVREISKNLVYETEQALEQFHEFNIGCNDLMKTEVCQRFSCLFNDIQHYNEIIMQYKIQFQEQLLLVLPKIRGGDVEESELANILKQKEESPFSYRKLKKWFNDKQSETNILKGYVQFMRDIEFASKPGDLQAACSNPDNHYVVCFTIRKPATDSFMTAMESYLTAGFKDGNQEVDTEKLHLASNDLNTDTMVINCRVFTDFYKANKCDKEANEYATKTIFIIAEERTDTESPGGFIYLYKNGSLVDKNYTPISKPNVPACYHQEHNNITLKWQAPEDGAQNITGYEIYCEEIGGYVQHVNTEKCYDFTVHNLQPAIYYIVKLRALSDAGASVYSDPTEQILTLPTSSPGKPSVQETSAISAELVWSRPAVVGEKVCIHQYIVFSCSNTTWMESKKVSGDNLAVEVDINANTAYKFKVIADCLKFGHGEESPSSDDFIIKAERTDVMKANVKKQSTLIPKTKPPIYVVALKELLTHETDSIRKYEFGQNRGKAVTEKVIMIVGATGSGKTTLINSMINYILGVEWNDEFRFKLVAEATEGDQSTSQTSWVTSYTIHHQHDFKVPYTLTIIDTPGFGDTAGVTRDKKITDQIRRFFTTRGVGGIDHLDAVGFVAQSSLPRLTPTQKYIFDSILALFGKDIAENIFMLLTFADGQKPPVLDGLKAARMPFKKSFKFNNSALFALTTTADREANDSDSDGDGEDNFDEMFWKMGKKSFEKFLSGLLKVEGQTLVLTKDVLYERHQLEVYVQGIQFDIQKGVNTLEQLEKEVQVLKSHKSDIDRNRNFKYTVDEEKVVLVAIDPGTFTTNCLPCKRTCHYPCGIKDDEGKSGCWAMTDGKCRICPGKCDWHMHKNLPHQYEITRETVEKDSDDLKKRYEDALGKKLSAAQIIREVLIEFKVIQIKVIKLTDEVRQSIKRLGEIALKPNPLSATDYVELLIETEKAEARPGWKERVEQLTHIHKQTVYMKLMADQGYDPFQNYQEVIAEAENEDAISLDMEEEGLRKKISTFFGFQKKEKKDDSKKANNTQKP